MLVQCTFYVDHTVHTSLAACHLLKLLTLPYVFCGNEFLHGITDNLISQLTSLEISLMQGSHLSDAGQDYLAFALRKCSDLEELRLDGSLVTRTGKPDVIALFNALKILNCAESCQLWKLSITSICHSQSNILVFVSLCMCVFHARNKMLEELWFAVTTCGTHICELVAEFLQQNSKINELTLKCNNFIEEDGWEKLCSGLIASSDSLRTVTIEFTSEGDNTPEMVDPDLGQRIAEQLQPVLEAKPCLTIHLVGL
jgi:hypothetical protein